MLVTEISLASVVVVLVVGFHPPPSSLDLDEPKKFGDFVNDTSVIFRPMYESIDFNQWDKIKR